MLNRLAPAPGNGFGQSAARPVSVEMPADSLSPRQPQQLVVYQLAETRRVANPLPVAVRCLRPGESRPLLALLPDSYLIELRDADGQRRWQHVQQVRR